MDKRAVIKNALNALLFTSSMALVSNAVAGNWYAGGDLAGVASDMRFASGETATFETAHLRLKGGFEFTDWLAVEAQVLSPADDDQTTTLLGLTEYEIGPMVGVFAKPHLPLGPLDLYAVLGYSRTYVSLDCTGCFERDTTLEGVSYGAGLQFFATDRIRVSADYMVYFDDDAIYDGFWMTSLPVDQKNTAIGIGLSYAFR